MNILLTNDDGYQAEGINYLKKYLNKIGHTVFLVAPDSEKSGLSHSITIRDTIRLIEHKEKIWALRGTPADCVMVSLLGLLTDKIDLVIAGINHGPNLGRDIIYSGTAAAARQAGFMGYNAIALSIDAWKAPFYFEPIGHFLDQYLDLLSRPQDGHHFYNVNFPNQPLDQIKGVLKTIPCQKHTFEDELIHFETPLHGHYYWISGTELTGIDQLDDQGDAKAVRSNYISISKIKTFPEGESVNSFELNS